MAERAHIPKTVWVTCPECRFPFYVGPEYMGDHARGHPARADVYEKIFCRCPKCKNDFKIHESETPPPLLGRPLPTRLKDLP